MSRYEVVKSDEKINGCTEVYTVCYTGPGGHGCMANVWRSPDDGTCWCTNCSGQLVAMSRSCKHVQAVKRFVATVGRKGRK